MKKSALFGTGFLISFFLFSAQAALVDDLFTKGNAEFAAGKFRAAIADYNSVVASGDWSANLFYDLGNAYFRDGDFGHAILNYERALQIDRHHPEAEANLRIARDQAHSLELAPSLFEHYLNVGDANMLAIAAAVFFWLAVIFFIVRARGGLLIGAVFALLAAAVCVFAVYIKENGTGGKQAAVVIPENIEARVATADSARGLLALPPGSEVLILQERGDWNYAALPNNQRGWIPATAAEKIRL